MGKCMHKPNMVNVCESCRQAKLPNTSTEEYCSERGMEWN